MHLKLKYSRIALVMAAMCTLVFAMVRCMDNANTRVADKQNTSAYSLYTATEKCASCHKSIYETHLKTAHYLTGQPALQNFIKGSFENGENKYAYTPDILLDMQKRDSGFYQVAYFKGIEKKAMRFDMVIGSGVMGQSFLTWRADKLFQLPITYYTEANQWSNSPGFPKERVMIDRPVTSRCLECHVTYAEGKPFNDLEPIVFDSTKIIYGIDCQKCHGPGAKHVEYHTAHPQEKMAKFIINTAALSQQQQIDACALCHSGNIQKTKPSFSFTAGNRLADYFLIDTNSKVSNINLDVHGNQVGLLMASKCFQLSKNMNCGTCHNTHENQRGQLEMFSQKCTNCHNTADAAFNKPAHQPVAIVQKNCINCHMPLQTSKSIAVFLQGQEVPKASKLRTHFISIYPENKL
jgi:Cytochrome c554 and c-prime